MQLAANDNFSPELRAALDAVARMKFRHHREDHGDHDEDEVRAAARRIVIETFQKHPENNS